MSQQRKILKKIMAATKVYHFWEKRAAKIMLYILNHSVPQANSILYIIKFFSYFTLFVIIQVSFIYYFIPAASTPCFMNGISLFPSQFSFNCCNCPRTIMFVKYPIHIFHFILNVFHIAFCVFALLKISLFLIVSFHERRLALFYNTIL